MPGIECEPPHEFYWPGQSVWHSQSWWTLGNNDKVWLSGQIHSNGAAVLRWNTFTGTKWRRASCSIPSEKWSQTRLCTSSNAVQNDFSVMLTDTARMLTIIYDQVSLRWEDFQPKKVASQIQCVNRGARWVLSLLMTCQRGLQQKWRNKGCVSSIWFMWKLWSHNQHQKD